MRIFILFFLLLPIFCSGQFTDDFSDGDFTNNPEWIGDTEKFIVNSSGELQLNADAVAGTAYLSTSSQAIENASWEFLVKMSFNPSSNNYCDIYLISNSADLNTVSTGYFVKVGNTADEVSLYRKDPSGSTKIIDGVDKRLDMSSVNVRIKVTRDSEGNWALMSDTLGGTNYFNEGSVLDNTYMSSFYFGVYCKYTQTNSKRFSFDDFIVTGNAYVDNEPPEVLSISAISSSEINVTFSEPTDTETSLNTNNYSLSPDFGNPIYAYINPEDANSVIIQFPSAFTKKLYELTIENIKDLSGNIMERKVVNLTFPDEHDVIICEIMARSEPVVLLPNAKYIELYNRTLADIEITSWSISVSTTRKIPYCVIPAQSYMVLCNINDVNLFTELGIENITGVTNFPTLNLTSGTITLLDKNDKVIHTVSYSDSWYNDEFKKKGGYSLEMIDLNNPCEGARNWTATNDRNGGTPGKVNSVNANNPDETSPYPTAAEIIGSDTVIVYFSETLKSIYANDINNFSIDGFGKPIWIEASKPNFSTITMKFSSSFEAGKVYDLNIRDSIRDCSDNFVYKNTSIRVGIPVSPAENDIVINEILFYPYSGGKTFVELYNRSEKVLDLKSLWISNRNASGDIDNSYQISTISRLLLPGEYCAISTDIEFLKNNYHILYPDNLYKISSMPTFRNDNGTVVITNRFLDIIDEVSYDKSQHYKLLSSQQGVSLERVNYNSPSKDLSNWYSAAQDAGFATPGYKNSQFAEEIVKESTITITPKAFSPDNDGYEDRAIISYKLDEPGYTATMSIYGSSGNFIKHIINNEMLGVEGNLFWDGFDESNSICPMGIYILYIEMFNLSGKKIVEKHAIVLSNKK